MAPIRVTSPLNVGLIALACGALYPVSAPASTWRLVAVAQPLVQEGEFLSIGEVQYGIENFVAGTEVALTCAPNSIRMIGDDSEDESEDESEVVDLNAASRFGISAKIGAIPDNAAAIDTLAVTLDVTRVKGLLAAEVGQPCSPDTIVEATILCIRMNAARITLPAKFVKLRVLGPESLRRSSGVYPVIRSGAESGWLSGRSFDTCVPVETKEPSPVR